MERNPGIKTGDIAGRKKQIRREFLAIRSELSGEWRAAAERAMAKRLFATDAFRDAEALYCFVSFRDEPDTFRILSESLRLGKRTAVPKVSGKRQMDFFYIKSLSDLIPGTWGIPEPKDSCEAAPLPGEHSLVLLPGAVFDRLGNRIGYGGGYYDTYLQICPCCMKAGFAFSIQCTGEIPSDAHDVRADLIITEKELILCRQDCRKTR